jgi:tetratricopeptide (TPR) repeat protein
MDRFWLQIANAQALEHNGSWQAAAAILERLGAQVDGADRRCFVETRLARIYSHAADGERAEAHLASATKLAAVAPSHLGWQEAEVAVTSAWLAAGSGGSYVADRLLRRSCAELESRSQTTNELRIRNALIEGLTLRAQLAIGRGDLEASANFASKASAAAADIHSLDPQVTIYARTTSTIVKFLRGHDAQSTRAELEQCYALATNAGLTREAIMIATHIAGCMRLARRSMEAVKLLTPLAPAARSVAGGGPATAFFCEVVSSHLESRQIAAAGSYLAELQQCSPVNPLAQASVDLVSAKTHLARGRYDAALRSAEAAELGFRRLAQDRVVGTTLRLQAEALEQLGEHERALTVIKLAIEALAGRNHPTRLAAAYRVLASLSGEAKYAVAARRLLSLS